MELTKEEMRIAILAFTLQRDVEDSIDKDGILFLIMQKLKLSLLKI